MFERTRPRPARPGPGRLLAIWGTGGSPGCSATAAALTATVGRRAPGPVALLDGDLCRGGLTHLLGIAPGLTLGAALALPRRDDEPCAAECVDRRDWAWGRGVVRASLIPGEPGPGAPGEIDVDDLLALVDRLRAAHALVVVDVGDELPPRAGGEGHLALLARADALVVVAQDTAVGRHDFTLEYRLLRDRLAALNPTAPRRAVVNHMHGAHIAAWKREVLAPVQLELLTQVPHDWDGASRARARRAPLPVVDPGSPASAPLEEAGGRLAALLFG